MGYHRDRHGQMQNALANEPRKRLKLQIRLGKAEGEDDNSQYMVSIHRKCMHEIFKAGKHVPRRTCCLLYMGALPAGAEYHRDTSWRSKNDGCCRCGSRYEKPSAWRLC